MKRTTIDFSGDRTFLLLILLSFLAILSFAIAQPLLAQNAENPLEDPLLVPEISPNNIEIEYGFTGAELLLFGAIIYPENKPPQNVQDDLVILVRGPDQAIILREKQKVAGIWVNAESTEWRSAPSYFGMASTRPINDIVDKRTAAIYEFGLDYLQLSPVGTIVQSDQKRFAHGLVDLNSRAGLYEERQSSVELVENVLYKARLKLPASVPVGQYSAETFLIRDGRVISAAVRDIHVGKYGFELFAVNASINHPFLYGLFAVILSLVLGWLAGVVFRKN